MQMRIQSPTWPDPLTHTGAAYLAWLSSSRVALEAGMSAFIARDFDGLQDLPGLLGPLLPLLPRLDVAELLGQHHGRLVDAGGGGRG